MGNLLALTVWQPWASLLVAGVKDVVSPGWGSRHILPPGSWLVIHAGAVNDSRIFDPAIDRMLREAWPEAPKSWATLPRKALVGAVQIQGYGRLRPRPSSGYHACRLYRDEPTCELRPDCSPWASGPVCWCIARAVAFAEPLPIARGSQGLWPVPVEHVPAIRAAIAGSGLAAVRRAS